jgi:hypothetical protein
MVTTERAKRSAVRRHRSRLKVGLVLAAVLLVLLGVGAVLWLNLGLSTTNHRTAIHQSARVHRIAPSTLVATLLGPAQGYSSPEAPAPTITIPGTWSGATSILPVVATRPDWIEVRIVAKPPAIATAWIPQPEASLARTPFHIIVDLSQTRVLLFNRGSLVMCAPAAVGATGTPTPIGHFFLAFLAQAPDPSYGSFVIVTSALAQTTTDWQQNGQPVITIAGPLNAAAAIDDAGASVTSGAVRLLTNDLEKLRVVPAGSPIDVESSLTIHLTRHEARLCPSAP